VQTYEASVEAADGMRRDVIFNKATWLKPTAAWAGWWASSPTSPSASRPKP
jgi:hypothetical protein